MQNTNLLAIFLTGLVTGGLSCMAVQGGLLAATIAQRTQEKLLQEGTKPGGNATPILTFLLAKLVSYTILGFLLGWLGSYLQLSLTTRVIMQAAVAVFMLGTALNILNVHPIFRYFVIQPPRFLTRLIRKQSKSTHFAKASRVEKDLFAPGLLGTLTIFIPCGTTQAMMALAIGTGSPITGAAILFAFVLGTSPVFFLLGYFATRLGESLHQQFMKFAAYAIILLAVFNANNALALTGSNFTLENAWKSVFCTISFCNGVPTQALAATTQDATITLESTGYTPNNLTIKAGSQVTLKLVNRNGQGCIQGFTIPSLGVQKIVPVGSEQTVTFTAPSQPGQLAFMCSMGMYRGSFTVI